MSKKLTHLKPKEKERLERWFDEFRDSLSFGQEETTLSERDFEVIDFALWVLRGDGVVTDPRPGQTVTEARRVCILVAKRMLETGCSKAQAVEDFAGDGTNGIRYAISKNKALIKKGALTNYVNRYPDERPEKYLRESKWLTPADQIRMAIELWELGTSAVITDGVPNGL